MNYFVLWKYHWSFEKQIGFSVFLLLLLHHPPFSSLKVWVNFNWTLFSLDWCLASLQSPRPEGSVRARGLKRAVSIASASPPRAIFPPRTHLAMSVDIWLPLGASCRWRPGELLNILQCAGQPPDTNWSALNITSAKVEKPCPIPFRACTTTKSAALGSGFVLSRA